MSSLAGYPSFNRAPSTQNLDPQGHPLFIDDTTGQVFPKYDTDLSTATAEEIVAIEYLCAYVCDRDGRMWVVSEGRHGVARMTRLYLRCMVHDIEVVPMDLSYEYSEEAFRALLERVRMEPELRDEARRWIAGVRGGPSEAL